MRNIRTRLAVVCALSLLLGAVHTAWGVGVKPTTTRPPNDDCANSKPVGNVTNLAFDTTRATIDGPKLVINSPNVWFCYTATCTGCATISLAGSSFDTKLAVYDGCACYPTENKLIKSNDDSGGQQSAASIPVIAGHQYLIEVGGFNASTMGQGLLTITCNSQSTPPQNDKCAQAEPISVGTYGRAFDTTCATFDGEGRCLDSPNLWYVFTANRTEEVHVSLLGSEFDTKLAVYKGDTCYPKEADLIECNDDWPGNLQSKIVLHATAGQKYLIEVGGYNADAVGQGILSVSSAGGSTPPPPKDDCANALTVGNVTNQAFDTRGTTFDGPGLCMTSPNIWFHYTAAATGDVTVSLLGSGYDTMLAVYKGATCYPKASDMLGCNDDFGNDRQSQVTFAATAGGHYLIEIGGYGTSTGQGVLTITGAGAPPPPPGNANDCAEAKAIGEVENMPYDTTGATFDGRAYCMVSPNIWYCYTASCTGNVTVTLTEANYDTMLAVYNGCACFPDDLIECNDDFGAGYASRVTFAAVSGKRYLIEVGGYGLEKGHGLLTVSCDGVTPSVDKPDLGDAPDSTNNAGNKSMTAYPAGGPLGVKANYPTVHTSGTGTGPFGPAHINAKLASHLGKKITRETEADSGADEDTVNNINPSADKSNQDAGDDGVVFPVSMPHCRWTTFDYVVNVVDPNVDMYLNVWSDWNRDGDWDDTVECTAGPTPEWAVQNRLLFGLPAGLNTLTTPAFLSWHPETGPEEIWMRVTLSDQPWKGGSNPTLKGNGGSGPQTKYEFGETEDYYFTPNISINVCEDFNGDGVINTQDLVAFTAAWLGNCPE